MSEVNMQYAYLVNFFFFFLLFSFENVCNQKIVEFNFKSSV